MRSSRPASVVVSVVCLGVLGVLGSFTAGCEDGSPPTSAPASARPMNGPPAGLGGGGRGGAGGGDAGGATNGDDFRVPRRPPTPPSTPAAHAYDGQGFVVHEWGTNTVVVGSDGTAQRGLHHEEEDLPAFVYDRVSAGRLDGASSVLAVDVKMETPVTYFYSKEARTIHASVGFPAGVFTEWYPAVQSFYPLMFQRTEIDGTRTLLDPVLDVGHPFGTALCQETYGRVGNGLLDWGEVDILAPEAKVEVPPASLDTFTWSFAREVAANPLRITQRPGVEAAQVEKFLFYRGLGSFSLPLVAAAQPGGGVSLFNPSKQSYDVPVFSVDVTAESGAFHRFDGVAPGQELSLPLEASDEHPLADYEAALGAAVQAALVEQGLYDDEASAMVRTWARQWFRTPGRRVLYHLPQTDTELQIPLHVTPAPDRVVRVMMMRVEILTPEVEEADAAMLGHAEAETEAYFLGLGRFGEPRLRRAASLVGDVGPATSALLQKLGSVDTRAVLGE